MTAGAVIGTTTTIILEHVHHRPDGTIAGVTATETMKVTDHRATTAEAAVVVLLVETDRLAMVRQVEKSCWKDWRWT